MERWCEGLFGKVVWRIVWKGGVEDCLERWCGELCGDAVCFTKVFTGGRGLYGEDFVCGEVVSEGYGGLVECGVD